MAKTTIDPLQRGANLERQTFVAKFRKMLREISRDVWKGNGRAVLLELLEFAEGREKRTRSRKGGL